MYDVYACTVPFRFVSCRTFSSCHNNNNHLFVSSRLSDFSLFCFVQSPPLCVCNMYVPAHVYLMCMCVCVGASPTKNESHAGSQPETCAKSLNTIKERLQQRICNFFFRSGSHAFESPAPVVETLEFMKRKSAANTCIFFGVGIVWRA